MIGSLRESCCWQRRQESGVKTPRGLIMLRQLGGRLPRFPPLPNRDSQRVDAIGYTCTPAQLLNTPEVTSSPAPGRANTVLNVKEWERRQARGEVDSRTNWRPDWARIPALLPTCCVTLGKLPGVSESPFLAAAKRKTNCIRQREGNSTYPHQLVRIK